MIYQLTTGCQRGILRESESTDQERTQTMADFKIGNIEFKIEGYVDTFEGREDYWAQVVITRERGGKIETIERKDFDGPNAEQKAQDYLREYSFQLDVARKYADVLRVAKEHLNKATDYLQLFTETGEWQYLGHAQKGVEEGREFATRVLTHLRRD
jgi:hypothetical protein